MNTLYWTSVLYTKRANTFYRVFLALSFPINGCTIMQYFITF